MMRRRENAGAKRETRMNKSRGRKEKGGGWSRACLAGRKEFCFFGWLIK